jgi:hypothetical protein
MNFDHYKNLLIISTLLNVCATLFSMQPNIPTAEQPYHDKREFLTHRKLGVDLVDLLALITVTTTLSDAARALELAKKQVSEKINAGIASSWLTQLDAVYSAHVATAIIFDFDNARFTITQLFDLYRTLEQKILTLIQEMPSLDDEHKSDHLDAMLILVQKGKAIEDFLSDNLVPYTTIAQQWSTISTFLPTLAATVNKSMESYIPYKVTPALQAEFNAMIAALIATKALKNAQLSYASTRTWIAARLAAGDITPLEAAAWYAQLSSTYDDQTSKRLPQLQISQMYAKAKTALKTLKGYQTTI